MVPESITIGRSAEEGGVLMTLYRHSMSLRGAIDRGMFPPLPILNDFLQCGFDDVPEAPDCADNEPYNGPVMRWEPSTLTQAEYDAFVASLRSGNAEFRVTDLGATTYQKWFARCFA